MEKEIINILSKMLDVPTQEIKLESNLSEDLGADELDCRMILGAVQDYLGFEIESAPWDLYKKTVNDLMILVKKSHWLRFHNR